MSYIQAKHITKSYKEVRALKDISLDVMPGELFGCIGPDGAGKSSLFRIITTLLLPDNGQVTIKDMDIEQHFRQLRKIIGYMPGRFSLYHDLTVIENLSFFAHVFGVNLADHYELIKDIYSQIEPFKDRKAGALSGGMKQKLALSCALIHKPELLVLDEPTTGVDAVSRKEFWEMLQNLKSQGITIVVSTPYMDEASLCDRVALMDQGTVLQADTPDHIVQTYQKPLFAVQSTNNYHLMRDLQTYPHTYSAFLSGQQIHLTTKHREVTSSDIKKYLEQRGHVQVKVETAQPDIEDCFMDLMMKK